VPARVSESPATNAAEQVLAVIVLAAGEGTRMKSAERPKVLHGFAGR
jgi:CTP:molybdopterin cytidylyltransferase MocA